MFAHALPQGSLRSIEALPPTLTPNAIFAMAPPAPRRVSFLGACLVYTACGAGLMFTPTMQAKIHEPHTVRLIFVDPSQAAVLPSNTRETPPPPRPGLVVKNAPVRPEGWTPPLDSNAVPTTPTSLPERDASKDSTRAETVDDKKLKTIPIDNFGTTKVLTPPVMNVDFQQMRILSKVDPYYPPIARLAKVQGDVVLLMTVDPRGIPTDVKTLAGPHPSLEQEAMRAARLWRFEPASLNGQAVSAQFRLTILFRLK